MYQKDQKGDDFRFQKRIPNVQTVLLRLLPTRRVVITRATAIPMFAVNAAGARKLAAALLTMADRLDNWKGPLTVRQAKDILRVDTEPTNTIEGFHTRLLDK
jgi:hypothetical protein